MKTSILYPAVQLAALSLLVGRSSAQATATATGYSAITTLGCYSNVSPYLLKDNTDTYQTDGLCQTACVAGNHPVMAIVSGSTCFCGDEIPSDANKLPNNDTCNTPCNGFDAKFCGGLQSWTVYLSGIGYAPTASNITSSSASSSQAPTSATHAAETIVVTQSSRPSSTQLPSDDEGPNKVGIAVGVVVGVVAIAAIAAGVLFFLRHRRRRQLEEEHKAQAAVNSFVGSRASDQKSDARLDPSMASSYRRESIGSIADERDFSRRILQVRNPDRGSMTSVA